MFSLAKPIFIKDKSRELNVFAAFRAFADTRGGAVLNVTGATFYRVYADGKFLGFGPARATCGYARVDTLALPEGENTEIVIEMCGYFCRTLSTVYQPSFLMAEVVAKDRVLAYTGRDFEAFLPTTKLQKVERYSRQRHFSEIWDMRGASISADESFRAEVEVLSLDIKPIPRRAPYALYEDIALSRAALRGTYKFDEALPFKKEKYSRGYLPEGWGAWKYDEIEHHPHTWIQRQAQTVTEKDIALPLTLKKGEYAVLDFSHIEVGFFKAAMRALKESDIVIAFTEFYLGDIFTLPNMNAHNVLEYFLGEGRDYDVMSFEPYSARYALLAVKEGEIELSSFGIKTFMFDISDIKYPELGDGTLDSVYRAAARTFAHNSLDIYMDCPSRERAGWLCDSYFTSKTEYALTGKTAVEDAFLENYVLYENRGEIERGAIPMCYPADVETDDPRFIPQWTMWYILEVRDYILKRGHADKAEDFRKSVYMLLDFYRRYENGDGLLERLPSWNFVEWSAANDWTNDVNYPTNFLYAGVLDAIADIYGDSECRRRADNVREAATAQSFNGTYFHDHALRDENGALVLQKDASEAGQYYALLFGNIDMKSERYAPLRRLITDVFAPDRGGKMPEIFEVNAFIGAYLRIDALLKLGEYELLLRDIAGFFGDMDKYTGTLWEYRNVKGSCDHGFASYALVAIKEAKKGLSKQ